jgi:hypothetical protein
MDLPYQKEWAKRRKTPPLMAKGKIRTRNKHLRVARRETPTGSVLAALRAQPGRCHDASIAHPRGCLRTKVAPEVRNRRK